MTSVSKWVKASRSDLVFQVAGRSLEGRLSAVLHYLPLASQQAAQDREYVHQLRVWTRRATAAIRLYRDLVPWSRAVRLKEDLSRMRRAANDARDLDVLALRLEEDQQDPAAAQLLEDVRARRAVAQRPLVELFERLEQGHKFDRRTKKFLKKIRQRAKTDKLHAETFGHWARTSIRSYVDQFLHDGNADLTNLDALHQFRISGKKLRYTMELLASAFPPRFAKQLYPRLESLQDRLGHINDLATGLARYEAWLLECQVPAQCEYVGHLAQQERQHLEAAREEFLQWWTPARHQRFARAFDRLILPRKRRGEISST